MDTPTHTTAYWKGLTAACIPSTLSLSPLLFDHIGPGAHIIDIGCGPGHTLRWLAAAGYHNLTGVDINAAAMQEQAGQPAPPRSPAFVAADSRTLPFAGSSFDCAITQAFWTTIADYDSRAATIRETGRVLRPGGIFYLADFARNWQIPRYRARYEAGLRQNYEPGTFAVTNPQSGEVLYLAHHFTTEELRDLLTHGGLAIIVHEQPTLTTRSGNTIRGHIIVARKVGQAAEPEQAP